MNDKQLIKHLVARVEALELFVYRDSGNSFEDEIIKKETRRLGISDDQYIQVKNERGGAINFRATTLGGIVCSVSLKTKDKFTAMIIRNKIILALIDSPKKIDLQIVKAICKWVIDSHYMPEKDVF